MAVMAIAWVERIRKTGELKVYVASSVSNTPWSSVVSAAVKEFNSFNKSLGLGVTLKTVTEAPTDTGGADVKIEAASDSISATWGGRTSSETFNGKRLHGRTFLFRLEGGNLEKAFVFLPLEPHVETPKGPRLVGSGVMRFIAVHELVHACGLDDKDHVPGALFQDYPKVDYGDTAEKDKVVVSAGKKKRRMPPLALGTRTVQKIKLLWPAAKKK
jgi:hypothetical protein